MTPTQEDLEAALDLLMTAGAYANYWADAHWMDDNVLVVREREPDEDEGDREWWLRPDDVLHWLDSDGPSDLVRQLGDPAQQAAVALLKARDWEAADWDAETADCILQQMILDRVVYG